MSKHVDNCQNESVDTIKTRAFLSNFRKNTVKMKALEAYFLMLNTLILRDYSKYLPVISCLFFCSFLLLFQGYFRRKVYSGLRMGNRNPITVCHKTGTFSQNGNGSTQSRKRKGEQYGQN